MQRMIHFLCINSVFKLLLFGIILLLSSCGSTKETLYLQDVDSYVRQIVDREYEAVIYRDDLLAIMVNSRNHEVALPFNMPMITYQVGTESPGQQRILGYLVDSQGYIDFPILGKIKAEGLTRAQLTEDIKSRLIEEDLIKDPIVTIQFLNFKISVLGEVARPGTFSITGDRITLFEALSMAGDLTIYGKRDRVAVIREENGTRIISYHDLRYSDVFHSPYYYLHQNDIVYVEPNRTKAAQSSINQNNTIGVWVSVLSLLTTVAVLIFK